MSQPAKQSFTLPVRETNPTMPRKSGTAVQPKRLALALSALSLLLAGCSIKPEPLTPGEQAYRAHLVRSALYVEQEPLTGPVTVHEAVARGLSYNLDRRLALMEQALQERQLDLTKVDLLPRLAANAGYTLRNNVSASSSFSILSGRQSLEPSTSTEREGINADLTFSWNLLDFGLSYYQAKQQADRVLVTAERKRRVVNNIVQEIRSAFWQAATAERLLPAIDPLIKDAEEALQRSRAIERDQLGTPVEQLEYQKSLLEVLRTLRALRTDVVTSKARLASLMNIAPGTNFTLALPPDPELEPKPVAAELRQLEMLALVNRPELREEDYQMRIGMAEVDKARLRYFPSFNLIAGGYWDGNRFLVNNFWADAGVRMSYNLVGLLSAPTGKRLAEAQIEVARTRQLALSVAIITQVNIAHAQYAQAMENYRQAVELDDIEKRILRQVANAEAADAQGSLDRIRRKVQSVGAELQRGRALADMQTAYANVFTSLGVDPLPETVEATNVRDLAEALRAIAERWGRGELPPIPEATPPEGAPALPSPGKAS